MSDDTPSRGTLVFAGLLSIVLLGSMIVLVVVLTRSCGAGRTAIETYIDAVRAGTPVSAAIAGVEASVATRLLRQSTTLSVSNFQSQQGTSCFWVTLGGSSSAIKVRFVLVHGAGTATVRALSLSRKCECPIDVHKPCQLLP